MANTWSRGRMSKNVNNDRYVSKHSQTYEWLSPALQPRATLLKFSRPFLPSTPSAGSCQALFSRLSFVLRIIASNCSKLGLVWFILRSGGIELIYIRGRGQRECLAGKISSFWTLETLSFAFWWTVTIALQIPSLQEGSRRRVCLKTT